MSQERPDENVTPRASGEELPPELKAVEAELADLCPREDRLDRERLAFLAGQASVAGRTGRTAWAWPASLAGMTAVAATLLVILLVRPGPAVVERIRIVEAPVEPNGGAAQRDELPSAPRLVASRPDEPAASSDTDDPSWRSDAAWPRLRSRASEQEKLDRMLAQDADPRSHPAGASASRPAAAEAPLPYHEWLKSLFDDRPRASLPDNWPNTSSSPGASS
ncbi:MAG: hypothetical protein HQ582_18295 [Planctomycetes bacterium]|nr:hypothetical protein [Planctomycetota bacterium]